MLVDEQKDWSPELKAKAKDYVARSGHKWTVSQLNELIKLVNWAREEMELDTMKNVNEWYGDQAGRGFQT